MSIVPPFLLSILFLTGACGEDRTLPSAPEEKEKEKEKESNESEEEESDNSLSGLLARGTSLGENALKSGRDTAQNAANSVTDTFAKGNDGVRNALDSAVLTFKDGQSWSEQSLSEIRTKSEELVNSAGDKVGLARDTVNSLVMDIATATSIPNRDKIERMLVLMLPVIGPSKRYLDARTLFADGRRESDAGKVSRARRETLLACAEMGLDIGTFGLLGTKIDHITTGAEKVLILLKVGRTVNVLSGSDGDILRGYLDSLLEEELIVNAIDSGLSVGS